MARHTDKTPILQLYQPNLDQPTSHSDGPAAPNAPRTYQL